MPDSNKWSLVIIEDNEFDAQIVARMCTQIGVSNHTFFTTAEDFLESDEPFENISCILLDHSLPGMDGLECLQEINSHENAPPVIMLTGCVDEKVVVQALKDGARDYVVKDNITPEGISRAISNSIEKHQMMQKLNSQYREAKDFASIVAHDLKSPLRVVILGLEMLEHSIVQQHLDQEQILDKLSSVKKNALFMKNVIDGLIGYVQHGRSNDNFVDIDLNDLIDSICENLCIKQQFPTAQIKVSKLGKTYGDPTGLTQLFQNVILNGLKYNDKPVPIVEITRVDSGGDVCLTISDNGIGIEDEFIEQIFKPMTRLHARDQYSGSGLGLAIVQRVVDQHSAKISATSTFGQGTTFKIDFPKNTQARKKIS
ncbi:MAG: ATP-binding protein [Alphaproteobacteria bacterium]